MCIKSLQNLVAEGNICYLIGFVGQQSRHGLAVSSAQVSYQAAVQLPSKTGVIWVLD